MNGLTKKCLSLLALTSVCATISYADDRFDYDGDTYSRSDIRHNFRDHRMGDRYRETYRRMDICAEVKEDLAIAEDSFFEATRSMDELNSAVRNSDARVRNKRAALQTKRSSFQVANNEVTRLAELNQRKPNLLERHRATRQSVREQLPQANAALEAARAKVSDKCGGFWRSSLTSSSCRKAKREREAAEETVNNLVASRDQAITQIEMLQNLDSTIAAANRTLQAAQDALANEEAALPSLVQLENELVDARSRRDANNANYNEAEQRYARIAIRKEKCMEVQFEARKARAFKNALIMFAADNGLGCEEYRRISRRSRGYAAKEGIDEAYELVCTSNTLVRYVETGIEGDVSIGGDERRGDRGHGHGRREHEEN